MPPRIVPAGHVRELPPDQVLHQVSWITDAARRTIYIPPVTEEERDARINREVETALAFFARAVRFLQDHGFTTRVLLDDDEAPSEDSRITVGDLTVAGVQFYGFGIRAWIQRVDRNKDKERAISDLSFIEKKLAEFRALTSSGD